MLLALPMGLLAQSNLKQILKEGTAGGNHRGLESDDPDRPGDPETRGF